VADTIARQAFAAGGDAEALASALVEQLRAPGLQIAFVFGDHRLDPVALAGMHRALGAPVIGGLGSGVIGPAHGDGPAAVALGLYGDGIRAGIGVATELSRAALARSGDAVQRAAAALDTTADALDPGRHIAITLIDGRDDHVEAFCIGSAAAAPRIRFIGGCTSTAGGPGSPCMWANGELLADAGLVVVLDSDHPFHAVTSAHLVPTELKTVVTAVSGRMVEELDGRPAAPRLRQLLAGIGDRLDEPRPSHAFARYLDGVPYVRSLHRIVGDHLELTCAVELGHVLRVMRPGDLIGTTRRDLTTAATRAGGSVAALLVFSNLCRHAEARARGTDADLAAVYAGCRAVGLHTQSEQSGMLLVNHTMTGLAIGALKP